MRNVVLFLSFILFLLIFPLKIIAADFNLVPSFPDVSRDSNFSYFEYQLDRDQEVKNSLSVVNLGDKLINVRLSSDNNISDFTLTLPKDSIAVKAGNRTIIPFTLKVNKKTQDGEYNFKIFGKTNGEEGVASTNIKFNIFVGKNKIIKALLTKVNITTENNKIIISSTVANDGNYILTSLGFNLILENKTPLLSSLHKKYEYFWGESKEINPQKSNDYYHEVTTNLIPGHYNAKLIINYGKGLNLTKDLEVNYYNKKEILLSIIIILIALISVLIISKILVELLSFFISKIKFSKILPTPTPEIHLPNIISKNKGASTSTSAQQSIIKSQGLEGLVKEVMKEEETIVTTNELSYEKILFEVRKVVRQEIELWKEMENFKKQVKEELKKEEQLKRMLKEEMKKK